jgi:hypothetical protein
MLLNTIERHPNKSEPSLNIHDMESILRTRSNLLPNPNQSTNQQLSNINEFFDQIEQAKQYDPDTEDKQYQPEKFAYLLKDRTKNRNRNVKNVYHIRDLSEEAEDVDRWTKQKEIYDWFGENQTPYDREAFVKYYDKTDRPNSIFDTDPEANLPEPVRSFYINRPESFDDVFDQLREVYESELNNNGLPFKIRFSLGFIAEKSIKEGGRDR